MKILGTHGLTGGGSSVPTNFSSSFVQYADDFIGAVASHSLGWATSTSGAGALSAAYTAADSVKQNHPGIHELETGTTTTGGGLIYSSLGGYQFGGGNLTHYNEWNIYIPNLWDVTDDGSLLVGFGITTSAASAITQTAGFYFEYTRATSTAWLCKTVAASTTTSTTSAVTVAAASWIKLGLEVNAAGTSAVFTINGTTAATHTTNIPTSSADFVSPMCFYKKSAGTTSRMLLIDLFILRTTGVSERS